MKSLRTLAIVGVTSLAACTTNPYTGEQQVSNTAIGAGAGAALGGLAGAIIGNNVGDGDARRGALIGAGIGALAGGGAGLYMDRQEAQLRQQLQNTGVSVSRVGDQIILNMPSNITFDVNQSAIKPQFYSVLNSVSLVLREYNQTLVDVFGFTDSDGPDDYNLRLSQQRAESVAAYLSSQGVDPRRFLITGFGETRPVAPNDTAANKALNRRVEIRLSPLTAS